MKSPLLVIAVAFLPFFAAPAPAVPATPGATAVLDVADQFVIPRYRQLARSAQAQSAAWAACGKPSADTENRLRAAYQTLADDWARIEFVRTGPMGTGLRAERFNYWPEVRNATSTALNALLAGSDNLLTAASFVHDFIPAQGLPAMERLLYDRSYASNARRCVVGQAIARNLAAIANEVLQDWIGRGGLRAALRANTPWNKGQIAGAYQVANDLLTDLVSGFSSLRDQKISLPMGASAEGARPHLAEAWRSARSARDIRLNVAALHVMAHLFAQHIRAEMKNSLDSTFAAAERAAAAIPEPLDAAVGNGAGRAPLEFAAEAFRSAQSVVAHVLAPSLGASVGFNALDGD